MRFSQTFAEFLLRLAMFEMFGLHPLEDLHNAGPEIVEDEVLIPLHEVFDQRTDTLSGSKVCTLDMTAVDNDWHTGVPILPASLAHHIPNISDTREHERTIGSNREILEACRGVAKFLDLYAGPCG